MTIGKTLACIMGLIIWIGSIITVIKTLQKNKKNESDIEFLIMMGILHVLLIAVLCGLTWNTPLNKIL